MKPLGGILVVSVEQAVAAPFCTRQLADLGARVIKVERPGKGDFARQYDDKVKGLSSHFVWANRGKESVRLDLKSRLGQEALRRLLARADVFVGNLGPGVAHRLGFGLDELTEGRPGLIACRISGFGEGGPLGNRKAYDLLAQCEAGFLSVTGTGEVPSKAGISLADIAAGMYAFTGILAALYVRERTGEGAALRVSLLDALSEWMGYPMYYTAYGGEAPPRTGAHHATIFPYGPFRTAEGEGVFVAVQNEREWRRFTGGVLGRQDLAEDPALQDNVGRIRHRAMLETVIGDAFSAMTTREALGRLEREAVAHARLREAGEVFTHPQLRSRGRFHEVRTPRGPIEMLLPPVIREGWELPRAFVPDVGEDTQAVLQEIGFDREDIRRMEGEGS